MQRYPASGSNRPTDSDIRRCAGFSQVWRIGAIAYLESDSHHRDRDGCWTLEMTVSRSIHEALKYGLEADIVEVYE